MPARDALLSRVAGGNLMHAITVLTAVQFGSQALGALATVFDGRSLLRCKPRPLFAGERWACGGCLGRLLADVGVDVASIAARIQGRDYTFAIRTEPHADVEWDALGSLLR